MGHLLINTTCFEKMCDLDVAQKDNLVNDFIRAVSKANSFGDKTYQDSLLGTHHFPFGDFYSDFIYAEWETFRTIPCFEGLNQATHQNLISLLYANPSGGKVFQHLDAFLNEFDKSHFGFIGILVDKVPEPYISSLESWNDWYINFYIQNQNLINWDDVNSHCLPNKPYSDYYLAKKLKAETKAGDIELILMNATQYCNSFPISKMSRGELMALAITNGREVARRNYFKENSYLSTKESQLQKSERMIFESVRNGRIIYFSIDFHKCNCYELCDHNGKHLGEFRFDGFKNSEADKSGAHDLLFLKK